MSVERRKHAGTRRLTRVIAVVCSMAFAGEAMAQACVTAQDDAALSARMMQTELMVAALTCQRRDEYNRFVRQFGPELVHQGKALKAAFKRMYGGAGETNLNRFVTRLANEASLRSLNTPDYCGTADGLFAGTFAVKPGRLKAFAVSLPFGGDHGLPYCQVEEQRVAQAVK